MKKSEQIRAVLSSYPGWNAFRDGHGGGYRLEGTLRVESQAGGVSTFKLKIVVPPEFPAQHAHPKARILWHNLCRPLTDDAHVDSDGWMCVQMEERNEIDYREHGLLKFMEQVELHLRRARIWALTGKFPGPQYSHGIEGRREYLAEVQELRAPFNAVADELPPGLHHLAWPRNPMVDDHVKCPCKSGRQFVNCHKTIVGEVRKRMSALGPEPQALMPSGSRSMLRELRRFLIDPRKRRNRGRSG